MAIASAHSRKTQRLTVVLQAIVMACGGQAGSQLADRLGIPISSDSLLREARRTTIKGGREPRAIGVDDWAYCKGQRYGTLICDLESGERLELLPDRDADQFAEWLRNHPGIEIISRDRGDIYRKGATLGASQAVQVADRFHLVKNLREAFSSCLEENRQPLGAAIANALSCDEEVKNDAALFDQAPTKEQQKKLETRERKLAVYKRVIELRERGMSDRAIAKQVGIHRSTVRKYLRSDGFPERHKRHYPSQAKPFEQYLQDRWNAGCHNARLLWKEIQNQGFNGSYHCVRRFIARWSGSNRCRTKTASPTARQLSPNQASWLFFKDETKLSEREAKLKHSILSHCHEIRHAWQVTRRFIVMIRRKAGRHFERWLKRASVASVSKPIRIFAKGLTRDLDAVIASLTLPWNNGVSEGHVGRLKMLKRQMYGRANFDLLRARFLGAA